MSGDFNNGFSSQSAFRALASLSSTVGIAEPESDRIEPRYVVSDYLVPLDSQDSSNFYQLVLLSETSSPNLPSASLRTQNCWMGFSRECATTSKSSA